MWAKTIEWLAWLVPTLVLAYWFYVLFLRDEWLRFKARFLEVR